tara:strand:- start:410 stop:796 length:387 start_codon:yes stop_codon:yes gene_type:complete
MAPAGDLKHLLETTKNRVVYKQEALMDIMDSSAITFLTSTIESVVRAVARNELRLEYPVVSSHLAAHEGYECVQIVAPLATLEKSKFLYTAEDKEYIIGTAIIKSGYYEFEKIELVTYGHFPKQMNGT